MNFREQYNYNLKLMKKIEEEINKNPEKYDELYSYFDEVTNVLSQQALRCKNEFNHEMTNKEILEGFEI